MDAIKIEVTKKKPINPIALYFRAGSWAFVGIVATNLISGAIVDSEALFKCPSIYFLFILGKATLFYFMWPIIPVLLIAKPKALFLLWGSVRTDK